MNGAMITRQSGNRLADDLRKRRFQYDRKRATSKPALHENSITHWKTPSGGIPAGAVGGQMGSATCTKYTCSPTGLLALSSETATIYNPFGAIVGNKDILVDENEEGLLVVIAVRC